MQIVHIVPATPGGVIDYATRLAEHLVDVSCPGTLLAVGNSNNSHITNATCTPSTHSLQQKLTEISPDIAILHYVNYGYEKRGCPFFLAESLKQWKKNSRSRKLLTVFHEVKASGPPWRSAFWLSTFQTRIARQILQLSDAAITSMQLYKDALARISPSKADFIHVSPVFSNVGEPESLPRWDDRMPQMIVFGGKGARERVFTNSQTELIRVCETLQISEVIDIGPNLRIEPKLPGIPVRSFGHLEPQKVSTLMLRARAGFLDYPIGFLTKSTIFAAYCAHTLLPIISGRSGVAESGLQEKRHYWNVSTHLNPKDGPKIAEEAHNWYRAHRLQDQIHLVHALIHNGNGGPEQTPELTIHTEEKN